MSDGEIPVFPSHVPMFVPPHNYQVIHLFLAHQTGHRPSFDQVLRTTSVPVSSATDSLLTIDQTTGTGICTGDSGGPAFIAAGKGFTVVGIMIGVASPKTNDDYCRGSAYFVSLPRWTSWIESAAAAFKQPL